MASSFAPTDLADLVNPYPALAELRGEGAIVRLASGFWAATGYDAVHEILRERRCASGMIAQRYLAALPPGAARDEMSNRINFLDPPDHTRVRGLISKGFTPRRISELVPWIEATANRLVDELDSHAEIDLLHQFAHQLPSLVISELLGVPTEDRDRLTTWSDEVAPLLGLALSDEERARAIAASEEFHAYLAKLIEERRREPREDLLSALLFAEENNQRLSRVELTSLAATLYSAGHRTTRDLFSNGMSVLLTHPKYFSSVVRGQWPVADVVSEFLRYETPTLFVVRFTTETLTICGKEIGANEPIFLFLSAANRDPETFSEPDTFRPRPEDPPALSFAYGEHYCLGAALARAEAEVMLRTVANRWPDLKLATDAPLSWHQRGPFRGLDRLLVRPR